MSNRGLEDGAFTFARFCHQAEPRFDSFSTAVDSRGHVFADYGAVFEAVT